ncbi:HET-domain-containing protein [Karstenula rhodostoma CBS 690.94]|uniref:HET-domain-containing protein n=1 Tax=Karstenula rhodostoma CBS 690.94 TaxID=1392251 RepID=A0A9P4PLW5_9PLEO|nr:HET-domain-containing protein [Karstenula rhodostoma CBS 690.94]
MPCRHHDIQVFDGLRCCLACGETVFDIVKDAKPELPRSQNAPYEYAHLNYALGPEIRLCVLFPGRLSDQVVVDLVHVYIRDHPPYEALSYAWATQNGDDSLSQTVHCHGGSITVTKTCEAALRRLRLPGRNRYLWVDALCIDQSNVKERNHQVGIMGTIYANASQVIIYLGPGTRATDRMLNYLNGDESDSDKRIVIYSVLNNFLDHRWFDRVWVLQEIALAKLAIMVVGTKTTHWNSEAINKVLNLCRGREPPSALRWLPASQPECDFLSVLHKSRNCTSTDPRDKVYAVLGLANADFQNGFPIDYSLTTEEVYTQIATHLFYVEGDLRILKYASGQGEDAWKLRGMSSWIPQWDVKSGYDPLPLQFHADDLNHLMSTWSRKSPQHHAQTIDSLNWLLDTFLRDLPEEQQPLSSNAWLQSFDMWLDYTKRNRSSIGNDSMPDLESISLSLTQIKSLNFHSVIVKGDTRVHSWEVADAVVPSPKSPCLRVRAHLLDTISRIFGFRSYSSLPHSLNNLPHILERRRLCGPCSKHFVATSICQHTPTIHHTMSEEFHRDMKRVLGDGKTMFETERSVGVAQAQVRVSDEIFALDGADVPFILRRVGKHYVLLGECFLYKALRDALCTCCGCKLEEWPIVTQIIDIW